MAKSKKELLKLVNRHLRVFRLRTSSVRGIIGEEIMKASKEYGFISDHGKSFSEKYCGGKPIPMDDADKLKKLLSEVKSWKDLGNLYFSYWREVTHYMQSNPFNEQHSKVFVKILEALRDVLEESKENK
ncbi:MAG: hypothetical protein LUD47_07710 [Clostridia bacterium]|nr:hypothetical protein [Clostridia bacterium]